MSLLDINPSGIRRGPELSFLRGGFKLGETSVPFFASCLPVRDVVTVLQLPSQIPVDPQRPIEVEELFQRDLDIGRINDRIVPYLQNPNNLRFFNGLTVALLPIEPGGRRLADDYPADPTIAPDSRNEHLVDTKIGPITLSHPEGNDRIGMLTWNADLTLPIVLDGQHRLKAMQIVMDGGGTLSFELGRSEVPVLFLVDASASSAAYVKEAGGAWRSSARAQDQPACDRAVAG